MTEKRGSTEKGSRVRLQSTMNYDVFICHAHVVDDPVAAFVEYLKSGPADVRLYDSDEIVYFHGSGLKWQATDYLKRVERAMREDLSVGVDLPKDMPKIRVPRRLVLPPGVRLAHILEFLLTRHAYSKFVEPVIRDMQVEYCDAIAADRPWLAKWITIRGHFLVIPGWLYGVIARAVQRLLST